MQHIEEAGVHSGDSTSVLPPHRSTPRSSREIEETARALALELGVVGLMNVQFAVKDGEVYVLEVNPRASRTVPFVSKATGRPLAKIAAKVMAGKTLDELGIQDGIACPMHVAVKESVFPFAKFPGVDTILGPEMRSTGEVMGIAISFAARLRQVAGRVRLRAARSRARLHQRARTTTRLQACHVARRLRNLGFDDRRHRRHRRGARSARAVPVERVNKVARGLAARRRRDPRRRASSW